LLVLAAFAGGVALSAVAISVFGGLGITSEQTPAVYEALTTGVYFFGMFAVAVWYLDWQDEYSLIGWRWPTKRDAAIVVVGSIVIVGVISALEFLLTAAGIELAENAAVEAGAEPEPVPGTTEGVLDHLG
jgi:uncharacterized membrane protein YidH (DUF202 family)